MISYFQAAVLGILQGISELFPVSSLGHSVLLPALLGWRLDQNNEAFLLFLVATHFATALTLFVYFRRDWLNILKGIGRSLREREIKPTDRDAKLGWMLVVGTIPAGILGLLFEDQLKSLLAVANVVSIALILNGLMLLGAEFLRRKKHAAPQDGKTVEKLSWIQTIKIGLMQCLALIPGLSRTGATITGGLLVDLSHEEAARFSFLLATPIIGAASLLKLPELINASERPLVGPIVFGAACAAVSAWFAVRFLTHYFETKKLTPFAIYCLVVGSVSTLVFFWR